MLCLSLRKDLTDDLLDVQNLVPEYVQNVRATTTQPARPVTTHAPPELGRNQRLPIDLKEAIIRCLAVDEGERPTLRNLLTLCEAHSIRRHDIRRQQLGTMLRFNADEDHHDPDYMLQ